MNYAIGDIQGCYDAWMRLLSTIGFNPNQDRLWLLGDLVNRGPDSLATLRYCLKHQDSITSVLGNHDLHLLACYYNGKVTKPQDTLTELLEAPDAPALMDWLRLQPLALYLKQFQCFLSHAGLYPGWDISEALVLGNEASARLTAETERLKTALRTMYGNTPQKWDPQLKGDMRFRFIINALTRMRFVTQAYTLDLCQKGSSAESSGLTPWFKHIELSNKQKILFGHWAALNGNCPQQNIHALDTGCVWGNRLTALCLETDELIGVPA